MKDREDQISPQVLARIGGALYLMIIVAGTFGEVFVRNAVVVSGDATATVERLRASEFLWRAGIAANLFHLSCAVALTLIFYILLRPAGRHLVLLAVFFNLVSIAIEAVSKLHLVSALFPLADARYLRVFDPAQLDALAYLSIKSHAQGFGLALIFFGFVCLILGTLIYRSGYLPKALGVLMQLAGACYLTNSFALVLAPALADRLFPAILLPAFVAEASLSVWLLVKGVNVSKWRAAAGSTT